MRARRWASVVKKIFLEVDRTHTFAFAASLAFYFVLSVFPAIIAISAVASLLPLPSLFDPMMVLLARIFPADSMEVVRHISADVLNPHRGTLLSIGLIGTLWSASSGFAGMIEALNIAYDATETRPFWKTRGLALLMTFLVGGLLFAALGMMLLGPEFAEWLNGSYGVFLSGIWTALQWIAAAVCIVAAVECTYFLGPNVKQQLGHTLVGAIFAVAAWLALSYGLAIYFHRFAHLNYTYGVLGGVIALMLWLYWSFFVILLGAEINGEVIKALRDRAAQPTQKPPEKVEQKPAAGGDIAA